VMEGDAGASPRSSPRFAGTPPTPTRVRLMSYNVRYFGHATRGLASTPDTFRRMAATIAEMGDLPDVLCLQELETQSLRASTANPPRFADETQLDRLLHELERQLERVGHGRRYHGRYFPAHRYAVGGSRPLYTTGLAVLVAEPFRIVDSERHEITAPTRLGRVKQTRIAAHLALVHPDGTPFDVFNTHLSLPNLLTRKLFKEPWLRLGFGENQLREAKNLLSFVERAKRSDRYFVVGDFNSVPGSPVDALLREEGALRCAYRTVSGHGDDEAAELHPTAGFLAVRFHLDRLFASHAVDWIDLEETHAFGVDGGAFHGLSDHVPLIARSELGLRAPPSPP